MSPMTWGQTLSLARRQKHVSQADVCAALNRTTSRKLRPQILSGWERDARPAPSAELVCILADFYGEDAVAWCALAGKVHPRIARALECPTHAVAIAAFVDDLWSIEAEAGAKYA